MRLPQFTRWIAQHNQIADHYADIAMDGFPESLFILRNAMISEAVRRERRIEQLHRFQLSMALEHEQFKHYRPMRPQQAHVQSAPTRDQINRHPSWTQPMTKGVTCRWTPLLTHAVKSYWAISTAINVDADFAPPGVGLRTTLLEIVVDFLLFAEIKIPVRNTKATKQQRKKGMAWMIGARFLQSFASDIEIFWCATKQVAETIGAWIPTTSKNTSASLLRFGLPIKVRTVIHRYTLLNPVGVKEFIVQQCHQLKDLRKPTPSIEGFKHLVVFKIGTTHRQSKKGRQQAHERMA